MSAGSAAWRSSVPAAWVERPTVETRSIAWRSGPSCSAGAARRRGRLPPVLELRPRGGRNLCRYDQFCNGEVIAKERPSRMHGAKPSRDSEPSQNFTSPGLLGYPVFCASARLASHSFLLLASPSPAEDGEPEIVRVAAGRRGSFLLPSEIVRPKTVQVIKTDWVYGDRWLAASRCRPQ
jgi:hypothetical protein